jgi:uncharacterized protein Yka (UPF0111/DUF47 family)
MVTVEESAHLSFRTAVDNLHRLWSDVIRSIESGIEAIRLLPSDTLIGSAGICTLVALLFLFAWLRVARRNRALIRQIKALEDDIDVVRTAYDKEVKWRQAADKVLGQQTNSPPQA